jgi:hypothetical protein
VFIVTRALGGSEALLRIELLEEHARRLWRCCRSRRGGLKSDLSTAHDDADEVDADQVGERDVAVESLTVELDGRRLRRHLPAEAAEA